MKAILVFDVDEFTYEAINDYFTGVIDLHLGNDKFIDFEDVILQPMPKRIPTNEYGYMTPYGSVWNECIDEILSVAKENEL